MTIAMPRGVDRATNPADLLRARLASSELRRLLERFVRRRVRAADVDDVVQTVLCDALAAERIPEADGELRRWVVGIARHKIADLHRRGGRERVGPAPELRESAPPVEERSLIGWAERQAPQTQETRQTLDWLAREGEGEKLAAIAEDAKLPAAQVRQRVSRLRRLLRERWVMELAAVAAVALLMLGVWRLVREPEAGPDAIVPEPPSSLVPPEPAPTERAKQLRAQATERCDAAEWPRCLELLDEARQLDPAGDQQPAVQQLRVRATDATREPTSPKAPNEEPTKDQAPTVPTFVPKMPPPAPTDTEWRPAPLPSATQTAASPSLPAPTSTGPVKPGPMQWKGSGTPSDQTSFDSNGFGQAPTATPPTNDPPAPSAPPTSTRSSAVPSVPSTTTTPSGAAPSKRTTKGKKGDSPSQISSW